MTGDQPTTAETLPTDEEPHAGMMGDANPTKAEPAAKPPRRDADQDDGADRAALQRESHERRET